MVSGAVERRGLRVLSSLFGVRRLFSPEANKIAEDRLKSD